MPYKFRPAGWSVKVYKYGLLPPVENAERVHDQLRKANRYRNDLTSIGLGLRAELRRIDAEQMRGSEAQVRFDEACTALERLLDEAKRANASKRSRQTGSADREQIKLARKAKRQALRDLTVARKEARARDKSEQSRAFNMQRDLVKDARELVGASASPHKQLYWGTYQLVEAAFEDSCLDLKKSPLYDDGEPNDPRFRRFDGTGRVGVQLQGGLPVEQVWGSDTQVRIDQVATWCKTNRHGVERRKLPLLWIRVGSEGPRKTPVWAKWPIVMHRPLPEGGIIKRADVSCKKYGPRTEWTVEFTIDDSLSTIANPVGSGGAVALHLGWLQLDDGSVRAGTWMSQHGETGEIVVPSRLVQAFRKNDELHSIRKLNFNEARDALTVWLEVNDAPEWLTQETSTLSQWKSAARLARLATRWRANRFAGDDSGFEPLEAWRYNDHHLWAWVSTQNHSRWRKDLFRVETRRLARRFGTLIIDNAVYSDMRRNPGAEDKGEAKSAKRNGIVSAPGELRLVAEQAFASGDVVTVPCAELSIECPECGSNDAVQKNERERFVACVRCTYHRDIDTTACMNMLKRAGFEKDVSQIIRRGHEVAAQLRGTDK